jgi:excisionase family DNA binding protein
MKSIVLTTPEELRELISEAVANVIPQVLNPKELPDSITLETAILVLKEFGFPTSKAKIYKLTSSGTMPFRKYGNKLVFSRKELLKWAEQQTKVPKTPDSLEKIFENSKRKRLGRSIQ